MILLSALMLAPTYPPASIVRDGLRLLLSPSGAQTISRLDGERTGYYYDLGELAGELRPNAKRVVLLGLGGGEMLRAARRSLPKADLLGVDINARVVRAAEEEFRIGDFGARGVVGDGVQYVKTLRGVDVLMLDMFDDDKMVPPSDLLMLSRFYVDCRVALASSGLLLVNVYPAEKLPMVHEALGLAGLHVVWQHAVRGNTVVFSEKP